VSVRLDTVIDTTSVVEIIYKAPLAFQGIELMGVDSGLSWLKGQSIPLKKHKIEDDTGQFVAYLEVADTCEFRARAFDEEGDHWEAGLSNHQISRNNDGTISFNTELASDFYYFKGSLPTDMSPSLDEATSRLHHAEEEDIALFQALVDLSIWVDQPMAHPLDPVYIYPISGMIRHLKRKSRSIESKQVDEVVRPVLSALFGIYKSALEFSDEDERLLSGLWEREGYIELFKTLPAKVEELEKNPKLGLGADTGDRFKDLLEFVS